MLVSFLNVLKT